MGLSLANLAAGKEIIHDVPITSLGDSIKVRELPAKALKAIRNVFAAVDGDESERTAVKQLFIATLTDESNSTMTDGQAEEFLENGQASVIREITTKIFEAHQGAGSGES